MHLQNPLGLPLKLSLISRTGKLYEIIPRETVLCTEIVLFCLALPVGDREPQMSPSSEVTGNVLAGWVISTEHNILNPSCTQREERVLMLSALSPQLSRDRFGDSHTTLRRGLGFLRTLLLSVPPCCRVGLAHPSELALSPPHPVHSLWEGVWAWLGCVRAPAWLGGRDKDLPPSQLLGGKADQCSYPAD